MPSITRTRLAVALAALAAVVTVPSANATEATQLFGPPDPWFPHALQLPRDHRVAQSRRIRTLAATSPGITFITDTLGGNGKPVVTSGSGGSQPAKAS